MDGPIYHGVYLGFCTVSKPPTGVSVLQSSIKELYLKFRRVGSAGRSASLKLIQHGILISLYEDGLLKDEIFFNYSTVNFVEAVKFATLKSSSERKPKALFLPVDESKGVVSDKHAFLLDKSFHFLVSASHPPLLACVVRRPKGVKALDCHVFALDTIENALHITSLIMSAQTPTHFDNKGGPGAPDYNDTRSDGSFNRGARGDVVRTEPGDYSFYRGPQTYDRPHGHPADNLPQNIPPQNGPMGIGDIMNGGGGGGGGGGGAGVRTSGNFPRLPQQQQQQQHQYQTPNDDSLVYGLYQQPRSGALIAGHMPRMADPSDVRRQGPMEDGRGGNFMDGSTSTGSERSFGIHRGNEDPRMANRRSGGYHEPGPMPRYIVEDPRNFPHGANSPSLRRVGGNDGMGGGEVVGGGGGGVMSPRFVPPQSHSDGGPVFSASNRENRGREPIGIKEDVSIEKYGGGKPVAKVPPHLKGVKVLPSDFKMVKLKHKESKRSDSSDDHHYDNNNEIMTKYKAMQEHEKLQDKQNHQQPTHYSTPTNGSTNFNYTDYDKEDAIKDIQYRHGGGGQNNLHPDYSSNSNSNSRNRFSAPVYADSVPPWGGGQQSHSAYSMAGDSQYSGGDDNSRVKDAEIASMFSNMRFQEQNHGDFEQGLGYLP